MQFSESSQLNYWELYWANKFLTWTGHIRSILMNTFLTWTDHIKLILQTTSKTIDILKHVTKTIWWDSSITIFQFYCLVILSDHSILLSLSHINEYATLCGLEATRLYWKVYCLHKRKLIFVLLVENIGESTLHRYLLNFVF